MQVLPANPLLAMPSAGLPDPQAAAQTLLHSPNPLDSFLLDRPSFLACLKTGGVLDDGTVRAWPRDSSSAEWLLYQRSLAHHGTPGANVSDSVFCFGTLGISVFWDWIKNGQGGPLAGVQRFDMLAVITSGLLAYNLTQGIASHLAFYLGGALLAGIAKTAWQRWHPDLQSLTAAAGRINEAINDDEQIHRYFTAHPEEWDKFLKEYLPAWLGEGNWIVGGVIDHWVGENQRRAGGLHNPWLATIQRQIPRWRAIPLSPSLISAIHGFFKAN